LNVALWIVELIALQQRRIDATNALITFLKDAPKGLPITIGRVTANRDTSREAALARETGAFANQVAVLLRSAGYTVSREFECRPFRVGMPELKFPIVTAHENASREADSIAGKLRDAFVHMRMPPS
jgi:hypothetical protein